MEFKKVEKIIEKKPPVDKKSNRIITVISITAIVIALICLLIVLVSPKTVRSIYLNDKIKDAADYLEPETRSYAAKLASKYQGSYNIDQICSIYDELYSKWKYVNDPKGSEYFSKASNTIKASLTGDCDDYAILMASLLKAVGGESRIVVTHGDKGGHAYAEVFIEGDPLKIREAIDEHYKGFWSKLFGINKVETIHYRTTDRGGIWLNLDWKSRYPGGPYDDYEETIFIKL